MAFSYMLYIMTSFFFFPFFEICIYLFYHGPVGAVSYEAKSMLQLDSPIFGPFLH